MSASIESGAFHLNDLENLPFFLVAGFLYMLTEPSLLLARALLYGYVVSRLLHFAAYASARTHDMRAMLWTVGSLILIFMTGRTLLRGARALKRPGFEFGIPNCMKAGFRHLSLCM